MKDKMTNQKKRENAKTTNKQIKNTQQMHTNKTNINKHIKNYEQ